MTFRRLPVNHFDAALTVKIPEPQCTVNWTTDDARIIKLQACDGILMAVKRLNTLSTERPYLPRTPAWNIQAHYTLHNVHAALLSTQQPAYLYYHQSYHQSSCLLVPLVPLACSRKKPTLDVFLSPLLLPKSRTIYLLLSESHHHLTPSNTTSKLTTLPRYNILTT